MYAFVGLQQPSKFILIIVPKSVSASPPHATRPPASPTASRGASNIRFSHVSFTILQHLTYLVIGFDLEVVLCLPERAINVLPQASPKIYHLSVGHPLTICVNITEVYILRFLWHLITIKDARCQTISLKVFICTCMYIQNTSWSDTKWYAMTRPILLLSHICLNTCRTF